MATNVAFEVDVKDVEYQRQGGQPCQDKPPFHLARPQSHPVRSLADREALAETVLAAAERAGK